MNRIFIIVLSCLALHAAEAPAPRSVYVLPMTSGMDQFLANRLAAAQVLTVVTDPKMAEVVLTDRLGQAFETRMDDLFPPPAPPKAKDEQEKSAPGDIAGTPPPVGMFSSGVRGKGNIFLVDAKTRRVLWSIFMKPADITPEEMDKTAGRIAQRLKKDLYPPAPKTKQK